jgi:hypothetical protein
MVNSPKEKVIAVRDGFEELIPFAEDPPGGAR